MQCSYENIYTVVYGESMVAGAYAPISTEQGNLHFTYSPKGSKEEKKNLCYQTMLCSLQYEKSDLVQKCSKHDS